MRYTAIPVLPARRAPRAQTSLGSRNDATKDLIQEDFIVSADKHIVVAGAGLGGLTFALSAVKQYDKKELVWGISAPYRMWATPKHKRPHVRVV